MNTYRLFATQQAPENTPFEGQELKLFVESEGGLTYEEIVKEHGFTALFFSSVSEVLGLIDCLS